MSKRYPAGFISAFYNPLQNPDAPTIGTASASAGGISVAFTAPSNVGGGAITSYIATAKRTSDGVLFTASGASSPITITGLTEVAFTATVIAINSYGPSAPSAASNSVTPLPAIGASYQGGYFAGQISTSGNSVATHNLVIGPVSSAENSARKWNSDNSNINGTNSTIDGPANTAAMVGYGAPCEAAIFCDDLTIGGFSDWYMPAKNELEICYYNLKPTTTSNHTGSGINANAVPARASNYTAGSPAQTSATDFITSTGAQAFTASSLPNAYWVSTQLGPATGGYQNFSSGYQDGTGKNQNNRVRAVRRVAV